MKMTPVSSSQIAAIGHSDTTLRVQFNNGSTYEYANVGADLFERLHDAESVGSFFSKEIKKNPALYPFTKVG